MKKFQTKILEINKKTESISEFILGFDGEIEFKNGQFLIIEIPFEGKILKRAYSIVEIKNQKIVLWIKNINGKGTSFLFSKKIGDELNIKTSFGNFFVKGAKENLVFLSTGIGIPPIISHLKSLFEQNKSSKKIQFIYGIQKKSDLFFEDFLKKISQENPNFSYKIFFSREEKENLTEKNFEKGYCTEFIKNENLDFEKSEFYFCGSIPLMKEIGEKLENFGVGKEDFVFEAY